MSSTRLSIAINSTGLHDVGFMIYDCEDDEVVVAAIDLAPGATLWFDAPVDFARWLLKLNEMAANTPAIATALAEIETRKVTP